MSSSIDSLVRRFKQSESRLDDFFALLCGLLFRKARLFKSLKVQFANEGTLQIHGRLFFGTFTNRNALSPAARGVFKIYNRGSVVITGNVRIARDCKIYVPGELSIANGTYINPGTMIFARTKISIGSGCAISWNCEIIDDDFHSLFVDNVKVNSPVEISIGNHVWLGSGVRILKGSRIEDNVVVAAGSVVTGHLKSGRVYGGVPARVLKENIEWR